MTVAAAHAFLDQIQSDEALASELATMSGDPAALLARVRAAGFDVSLDELREAVLDRYGATLTDEQHDFLAGGLDTGLLAFVIRGSSS
jgi:predicted ribosomally synthesized peptide with nif11-like leader